MKAGRMHVANIEVVFGVYLGSVEEINHREDAKGDKHVSSSTPQPPLRSSCTSVVIPLS